MNKGSPQSSAPLLDLKAHQVCRAHRKCASGLSVEKPSLVAVVVCVTCGLGEIDGTLGSCGKVFYHIYLLDWLRESMSIDMCVNGHPIKEGKVLSCHLPDRPCRTLRGLLQWTWQRFTALLRALNGLLLAFVLPFFLWHGDRGNQTARFNLKTIIWMQGMHRSSFLCNLEANLAHLGRLVSAVFLCFKS